MENRGRKRSDGDDIMAADKRPCSSRDCEPSSSNSSPPESLVNSTNPATETDERDGASSSASGSGQSEEDVGRDSYGSCDSDDYEEHHSQSSLEGFQRQRAYGDEHKINTLLPSLNEGVDPSVQLVSLTEICQVLLYSVGDSISGATADKLAPLLVNLSKYEASPDIMLFAIRAITYLCNDFPRALVSLVKHEVIPTLCQKLMIIEYMDVAEQCLQALEKISRYQPVACLQSGTIMAVLRYVDFLSTSMQRTAISTVLNICKGLPSDSLAHIIEPLPRFCDLLQYDDRQLVESVATCLIIIADKLKDSPDMFNELCKRELIHRITHIIAFKSQTTLSQPTYSGLIGLLAKLAAKSSTAVRELFNLDIGNVVKDILSNNELQQGTSHTFKNNCNEVHEILCLLNEMLPPIVRDQGDQLSSAKESVLTDQPEDVHKLGMSIIAALVQIVNCGANLNVCYGCILVISKLVHFSKPEILLEMVTISKLPSFLMGVFIRKDKHMLILALKITETLLQKLSDSLITSLAKEGVLLAIDALIHPEKCSEFISSGTSDNRSHEKRKGRDGCFCYVYNSNEPYSKGKTCKLDEESLQDVAQRIRTNYARFELNDLENAVTAVLQNLRLISAELNSLVEVSLCDGESAELVGRFDSLLRQMMAQIGGDEFVSTFVLIESGIIKAIISFLSDGLYKKEKGILYLPGIAAHRPEIIHKRFELFARVVSCASSSFDSKRHPLSLLVGKLQNALSTVEGFPIVVGNVAKLNVFYAHIPYGQHRVHPCLRVLFKKAEDENDLFDYSEGVTTVDPFCSLETIERFLLPLVVKNRVKFSQSQKGPDGSGNLDTMEIDDMSQSPQEVQDTEVDRTSAFHFRGLDLQEPKSSTEVHDTDSEESLHSSEVDVGRENYGDANGSESKPSTDRRSELSSSQLGFSGLRFYLDGVQLGKSSTLYQEIIRRISSQDELLNSGQLWSKVYTISFRKIPKYYNFSSKAFSDEIKSVAYDEREKHFTFLSSMVFRPLTPEVEKSSAVDLLRLLRIFESMNRFACHLSQHGRVNMYVEGKCDDLITSKALVATLSQSEFVNSKLSEKLEQQMLDLLTVSTGAMPLWCNCLMSAYPFVFSSETRFKYFQLAAFGQRHGAPRSSRVSDSSNRSMERRILSNSGSLPRQKFKVSRDRILESAAEMMKNHAHRKAVLEVEYSEEVGTGQGPTLEFFTLVSLEFQKPSMGMWRLDQKSSSAFGKNIQPLDSGTNYSSVGLFPRPLKELEIAKAVENFVLLGKIVARAIQDGRVLDIPFSRAFYKLILGQELTLYDVQSFDPELGQILLEFHAISSRQKFLKSSCGNGDLSFRGMAIDDLVLDFTLPGYPNYVLKSGGDQIMVTIDNLEEYVKLVLDATLNTGIQRQVEAFKSGFNQVFAIKHLQIFTEEELERLLCGEHDSWASEELLEHINLDHGYTSSSSSILNLLEIIQEFDYEQRRAFLQFITGAPRLPPGGLSALRPKLTIVRKHSSNSPDEDLPSVMTCANYLKLPLYSSKEKMKEKLLYAITEGQGSFHLS